MRVLKLKHFTKPTVLRGAGRPVVEQFLSRFSAELAQLASPPPARTLPDQEFFAGLAGWMMQPEGLPGPLSEALFAVDEMANAEGQQRLLQEASRAGLNLPLGPESTHLDVAMQVWLAAPDLLATMHNRQRMLRLTRFEYFGSEVPPGEWTPFDPPDQRALAGLVAELDEWFSRNLRGKGATRVELYPMFEEYWWMVRHGDSFRRTSAVSGPATEILHFRPERDDVVVYCPRHDEIRINARTKGERDLYREQFGLLLRGRADYFSRRATYTLEPLRRDGADSLDVTGLEGIRKITLRELEVVSENARNEYTLQGSDDLFADPGNGPARPGGAMAIPPFGRLARALFELQFTDSPHLRPLEIRPPNVLKLGRHCDARRADAWMCRRGYRRCRVVYS